MNGIRKTAALAAGCAAALTLLAACADDDTPGGGHEEWSLTHAVLTFSLPQRIVGEAAPAARTTRMTGDVVQVSEDVAGFRGLDDLRLVCFSRTPEADSRRMGDILELPHVWPTGLHGPTRTNHSLFQDIPLPVGTRYVGFYARALDGEGTAATATAADAAATYGALHVSGLTTDDHTTNASIRFQPVPICPSADALGSSAAGQSLLALLNGLMGTVGPEAAPNDLWATTTNRQLRAAYDMMVALQASSSFSVETALGTLYQTLTAISADAPGGQLAALIAGRIVDASEGVNATAGHPVQLQPAYQGFPADLGLPDGAARLAWNAAEQRFELPAANDYGRGMGIPQLSDYVYPANLQYHVFSDIVTADSVQLSDEPSYATWAQLIDSLYDATSVEVKENTRSVAVVQPLQYAVGRLDVRVLLGSGAYYDAYGQPMDTSKGFTLKGYLVGGQHEADYDFHAIGSTRERFIYDTRLEAGPQHVVPARWTPVNYILGLESPTDEPAYIVLELQNDGPDFQGADGRIVHGATFYLVGLMEPSRGENYQTGFLDQIFRKDFATKVNLTIKAGSRDVNGDHTPDTDQNGDQVPDVYLKHPLTGVPTGVDTDGDGQPDDFDANGDGRPDRLVTLDTNGDGLPDRAGWDTTGDGQIDIAIEPLPDGQYAATPTQAEGFATATYGVPPLLVKDDDEQQPPSLGISIDLNWEQGLSFTNIEL